jgi:ABC-type branched-subunit amino acid transport system ATPase component
MLTFEHVRKNYDSKRVLEDCSISFEPGKVYALVGPNGTGKSTLMKAAAGLVKINGGTLTYQWSSGRPLLRNEVTLWPLPVKTDTATTWADMGAWPVTWDMCRFTLAELALIRQFSQPTQEGSQG